MNIWVFADKHCDGIGAMLFTLMAAVFVIVMMREMNR